MKPLLIVLLLVASSCSMNRAQRLLGRLDTLNQKIDKGTGQKGFVLGKIRQMISPPKEEPQREVEGVAGMELMAPEELFGSAPGTNAPAHLTAPHHGVGAPTVSIPLEQWIEMRERLAAIESVQERMFDVQNRRNDEIERDQNWLTMIIEGMGGLAGVIGIVLGGRKAYKKVKGR